jgi:hypothetical protein
VKASTTTATTAPSITTIKTTTAATITTLCHCSMINRMIIFKKLVLFSVSIFNDFKIPKYLLF